MESSHQAPQDATVLCKNCEQPVSVLNFTMHELHCVRNTKLCPYCREPVNKSDFDQHIEDYHTMETCPACHNSVTKMEFLQDHVKVTCSECMKIESKCMLDQHTTMMHSDGTCPDCKEVVKKVDLVDHQASECRKRQLECQYCKMLCQFSDHSSHEEYCGSRTESCDRCGGYVMIRNMELHKTTECSLPHYRKTYDTTSKAGRFQRPANYSYNSFLSTENSPLEFYPNLPTFSGKYTDDYPFYGADAFNPPFKPESSSVTFGDIHRATPPVEDEVGLPCQFCGKCCAPEKLMLHQVNECKMAASGNDGFEYQDGYASAGVKSEFLPYDNVDDAETSSSSHKPTNLEDSDYVRDKNVAARSYNKQRFNEESVENVVKIKVCCDFCLQPYPNKKIARHQKLCYDQQIEECKYIMSNAKRIVKSPANLFRYPCAAMTFEQREYVARFIIGQQ